MVSISCGVIKEKRSRAKAPNSKKRTRNSDWSVLLLYEGRKKELLLNDQIEA